jgi:hypothetical protein
MAESAYIGIGLYAADIPSVSVTAGDAFMDLKFTKGCDFIVPQPKKKALWNDEEIAVEPWTWWIIADGYTQIGVTFEPSNDNSYVLRSTDGRIDTFTKITSNDAKHLFTSLKDNMKAMRSALRAGKNGLFKPAESMVEYHVKTWIYRHPSSKATLPPHGQFPPKFRPTS